MGERNADVPKVKQIVYRIGVNLGDVLIEGDDSLGEGVTIAARLEGICEAAGVLISSAARAGRLRSDVVPTPCCCPPTIYQVNRTRFAGGSNL